MKLKELVTKVLPPAPSFIKLLGPSFIILGMGLGSGEVILWPYMTSHYGMGVIWGALLGITFQFFMNMEIERYALVHGESVFVGLKRKVKSLPYWFLLSTFLPWIWPGIIASSAVLVGSLFGISETKYLAIIFLLVIGTILSLGPTLYKTVENFQKFVIILGVPTIFIITIVLAKSSDWSALASGVFGIGEGYLFFPAGISITSFLAALAYSGAGGNLNLAQSFYIKEKGYGMGKYAGKISSLITGKAEKIELTGAKFTPNAENIKKYNRWWRNINLEHFLVFWGTGALTIMLLGLLSYITTKGIPGTKEDISFVLVEAEMIGRLLFPFAGTFFVIVAGITLFGTQLTVLDATSRILTENILLTGLKTKNVSKVYYIVLWAQIISGIVIFLLGFTQPLQLLILAAVLNAFAMFVHTGLVLWLNMTSLDVKLRPSFIRVFFMASAFLFYGAFSAYVIWDRLF